MATPLSSLKAALCIVLVISTTVYARDWFGSKSQYKCHCIDNNNCGVNGDCTDGCEKGWFGPQCQYVDLSYTENDGTTQVVFRDADDTTCNDDSNHQVAIMFFTRTFPFTWLRLVVKIQGLSLDNIDVTFTDGDGDNIPCNNRKSALVDSFTVDIHCNVSVEVKKVAVTGVAIGHLCSFYVSGGRNVALQQTATQSTTQGGGPDRAVDGNTNQDNNRGGSCSHTGETTLIIPVWSVIFSRINAVNRYVIYNRGDCCEDRLLEFTLTSRNDNHAPVFSYHDSGPLALLIYTVTTATHTSPVKSVDITTSHVDDATANFPILTLCEVEIYGDTICPAGKYGKECEHDCHCSSNDACLVSTGRCVNGCAAGYTGDHCDQTCPPGFYGAGCTTPCNQNCDGGSCRTDNGHCNECKAGWKGTFCDTECDATHYGKGCKNQCNINCRDQQCNRVDGKCVGCIGGKMGDFCGTPCPTGYYGEGCTQQCNQNCDQGRCQADNGHCNECKAGWEGIFCEKPCPARKYGLRCSNDCSSNCRDVLCDAVSGVCTSCPSGKTGDLCDQNCPANKYGPRCINVCSTNCLNQLCDGNDGKCNECPPGRQGAYCDQVCALGTYGDRCQERCNVNCDGCDPDDGKCSKGCISGYTGIMCDETCPYGKYGKDCLNGCSEFCNKNGTRQNESACHHVSGACLYACIQNYTGSKCDTKSKESIADTSADSTPGLGVGLGIGLGVAALVVIVVVVIYCYRRRSAAQKSRRQRPPGYDPAEPTTDEHGYNELFKSHDGYNLPTDEATSAVTIKSPSKKPAQATVQYVNAEATTYEDIDSVAGRLKQEKQSKTGQDNEGYANL